MKKLISLNLYKDNQLTNSYHKINALYKNDTYSFVIDKIKTSLSDVFFIRENNEFKFILNLKNQSSTYLLKDKNMLFDIDVINLSSKNVDNNIILEYKLSSDDSNMKIELIIEGDLDE